MFPNFLKVKEILDANPPAMLSSEIRRVDRSTSGSINELRGQTIQWGSTTQSIDARLNVEIQKSTQFVKIADVPNIARQEAAKEAGPLKNRIDQIKDQIKQVDTKTGSAITKADQGVMGVIQTSQKVRRTEQQLLARIAQNQIENTRRNEALSGNIELKFDVDTAVDVSAAVLNAAAAGTVVQSLLIALVSKLPDGEEGFIYPTHTWTTNIAPTVTPGNTGCFDPTVTMDSDPEGTPVIDRGILQASVTFNTDEGSTKIYEIGDTVTAKVKIEASATMPWAAAEITKTYNVIA